MGLLREAIPHTPQSTNMGSRQNCQLRWWDYKELFSHTQLRWYFGITFFGSLLVVFGDR